MNMHFIYASMDSKHFDYYITVLLDSNVTPADVYCSVFIMFLGVLNLERTYFKNRV